MPTRFIRHPQLSDGGRLLPTLRRMLAELGFLLPAMPIAIFRSWFG